MSVCLTSESYESSNVFFQGARQGHSIFRVAGVEKRLLFGRFLRDRGLRFRGRYVEGESAQPQKMEWSLDREINV